MRQYWIRKWKKYIIWLATTFKFGNYSVPKLMEILKEVVNKVILFNNIQASIIYLGIIFDSIRIIEMINSGIGHND